MFSNERIQTGEAGIGVSSKSDDRFWQTAAERQQRTIPASEALGTAQRFGVLHGLFEAQADARPDAVAVVCDREETTYAELEWRANRLARYLRARAVGRGSLVAMLLPRSAEPYAALLGILKAGAAYMQIDPEFGKMLALQANDSRRIGHTGARRQP